MAQRMSCGIAMIAALDAITQNVSSAARRE